MQAYFTCDKNENFATNFLQGCQSYNNQGQHRQLVSKLQRSQYEEDRSDGSEEYMRKLYELTRDSYLTRDFLSAPAASVTGQRLHELPKETYSHFFDICDSEEGANFMAKCKHCGAKVREKVL